MIVAPSAEKLHEADVDRRSMIWIPGGTFLMGSDRFYREERPARRETVQGFWLDKYPVTNAEFHTFVRATGYVTTCERPPDPAMYPDADPALLVPGSARLGKGHPSSAARLSNPPLTELARSRRGAGVRVYPHPSLRKKVLTLSVRSGWIPVLHRNRRQRRGCRLQTLLPVVAA